MKMNRFTREIPEEPGWYWCRNPEADKPGEYWLAICFLEKGTDGEMVAGWMTWAGAAGKLHQREFSPLTEFAGPIYPPSHK